MNDPIETKMIAYVSCCDDPKKLRQIAKNASAKGADDLFRAAKLRLFEILPDEQPGTLEHDVWQSIFALEDALSSERGKTIRLSRTRQKIARQGEKSCVADLIQGPPSEGFRMLFERKMLNLSFEAVALRHKDQFDSPVLDAARTRLQEADYAST